MAAFGSEPVTETNLIIEARLWLIDGVLHRHCIFIFPIQMHAHVVHHPRHQLVLENVGKNLRVESA